MKSKYISTCIIVLILAVMYAVSIGTADARSTGRLIVSRDPSLGRNMVVNLRLDGSTMANLVLGSRFNRSVVDGNPCIDGVGRAKRLSVLLDDAKRAARSNIRVHGGTAGVGIE